MYAKFLSAIALAALAACAGPANRLDMSPVQSDLSLRAQVGTIMLRDVSLPTYAAADEIAREIAPGIIGTDAEILWADEPERAVTLAMTRHLDEILNATVGPDPWPFVGLPDVAVEVRVAQMLAGADGVFLEFHTEPDAALCDAPCCLPLSSAQSILKTLKDIRTVTMQA